ncbi:translocation/assembly module TamB [Myxococcota bacterium]|nr:translocation/assembly module TamB [Myxococcota bacterium]
MPSPRLLPRRPMWLAASVLALALALLTAAPGAAWARKPIPARPPTVLETVLAGKLSKSTPKLKSATVTASRKKRRRTTEVQVVFRRHPFSLPAHLGGQRGFITGELTAETVSPDAMGWRQFYSGVRSVRGRIVFQDINSPVFRNLGDVLLIFSQGPHNQTQISGNIGSIHQFSGQIEAGRWNVNLDFVGIQLEKHLPRMYSRFPLSITGAIRFEYDGKPRLSVRVAGLLALIPAIFEGRSTAVIRNAAPFDLQFSEDGMHLSEVALDVSGNPVVVNGTVSPTKLALSLRGTVDARRLSFLYPANVIAVEGSGPLYMAVTGSPLVPQIAGSLRIPGAFVSLAGTRMRLRLDQLELTKLPTCLRVAANLFGQGRSPLRIAGFLEFEDDGPEFRDLAVTGEVPPEILTYFFGRQLSSIQGSGRVQAQINGPTMKPRISGTLTARQVELKIRGMSQNIVLQAGVIHFRNEEIRLEKFILGYEDGDFRVTGRVRLEPTVYFDLDIAGNAVPYSIPTIFNAEVNTNLTLRGPVGGTELSGKVDLISGRYIQQYDVIKQILTIHRFHETDRPFWHVLPWLGSTKLSISLLNTGELEVENNVASLQLDGLMSVTGTLATPRLQGQLTVNVGTFKIPFFRGQYDVDEGTINFDLSHEPFMNIRGTTLIEDLNGDEVLIKLHLTGPLDKIDFTLTSIPDMEQGQIVMLLAAGRTTEDIRSAWRGSPKDGLGMGSGGFNLLDYYDAPIKQVTGDFLSMLVANPIKMVTRLDLFRVELGSDSFQVRMSKTFLRHITMKGEVEVGFLGRNRQEGGVQIKFFDQLWLEGMLRRYIPDFTQYEYEEPLKGRVELRYRMKFRGDLKDILGFW